MSWPPPDPRGRVAGPRGPRPAPGRPVNGRPVNGRNHPGHHAPPPRPAHGAPGRRPPAAPPWAQPPRERADLGTDPRLPTGRVWWGTGEQFAVGEAYPEDDGSLADEPFGPPGSGHHRPPPSG